MSRTLCGHRGCLRGASCGLGWGFGTGLVLWYCPDHLPAALARLYGLLKAAQRRTTIAA